MEQSVGQWKKNKVRTVGMCILRWMSGLTPKNRVRKERVRDSLIASIDTKLGETHLRWFGHFSRRPSKTPVHRVEKLRIEGTRRGDL